MAEREDARGAAPWGDGGEGPPAPPERARAVSPAPNLVVLRDVNEQLLIAGLREQELAATLEAERAQLAVILAGIGDAVLVVDEAGTPLRANAAYARLAGGADVPLRPGDAQGLPLPPTDTPQARAARGETFSLEFTLPAADGSPRWFEANGQPLHDGGAAQAVVVIRDMTLTRQHRHLQDEFLALASHELRTPLTSAQGFLDMLLRVLQRGDATERAEIYATRARYQIRRLGTLITDLTDVARLQGGRLTLDLTPVDLVPLTIEAVETARAHSPAREIRIDTGPVPLWVRGDAGRLEQVLLILLTTAIAYTASATPIDVRLRRVGAEVALEVRDYGRGIAPAALPLLFDRFYQVARPDRPSQGGLGLGLFICHELVIAHSGRIEVASTEGEGTTFTVWLPVLDAATARPD